MLRIFSASLYVGSCFAPCRRITYNIMPTAGSFIFAKQIHHTPKVYIICRRHISYGKAVHHCRKPERISAVFSKNSLTLSDFPISTEKSSDSSARANGTAFGEFSFYLNQPDFREMFRISASAPLFRRKGDAIAGIVGIYRNPAPLLRSVTRVN